MEMRVRFWRWVEWFAAAGGAMAIACFIYLSATHAMPNVLVHLLWPSFYVMLLLFTPGPVSIWAEIIVLLVSIGVNAVVYGAVGAVACGVRTGIHGARARRFRRMA